MKEIAVAYSKFRTTTEALVGELERRGINAGLFYRPEQVNKPIHADLIISWGVPFEICVENEAACLNNVPKLNKREQFHALREKKIRTPDVFGQEDFGSMVYPVMAKPVSGHGGKGIKVFNSAEELVNGESAKRFADDEDFILQEVISKIAEFRIHVVNGIPISWTRKKPMDGVDQSSIVTWNRDKGFSQTNFKNKIFRLALGNMAISAVEAVGYDFGAVDIIISQDGTPYVLEVNSAPALSARLGIYADAFANMLTKMKYEDIH